MTGKSKPKLPDAGGSYTRHPDSGVLAAATPETDPPPAKSEKPAAKSGKLSVKET